MRGAHGCSIGSYCQLCIESTYRDLEGGIAVLVYRLVFLVIHYHIVIVRAAPYDGSCSLVALDGNGCRRIHGGSAGTACESYLCSIVSVLNTKICYFLTCILFFGIFGIAAFCRVILYRIFDADLVVIPFSFFSKNGNVKLLINGRYRDIEAVYFFCHSVTVFYSICGRIKDFGSVFGSIFCSSSKEVDDLFGYQAHMDCHFAVFYSKGSLFVIGFIYMEHTAVCIKLSCVNPILQNCGVCSILGITVFGICVFDICLLAVRCFCVFFCFCQYRAGTDQSC